MQPGRLVDKNYQAIHRAYYGGKKGIILEGSSGCFSKDQLIVTKRGNIKISELLDSDIVLSFNHSTQTNEWKPIKEKFIHKNTKKCMRIKLKGGTIIECTEDHKYFYQQRYVTIKNIVSLLKK